MSEIPNMPWFDKTASTTNIPMDNRHGIFSNGNSNCQDERPPIAKTPEEADEILDRMGHG